MSSRLLQMKFMQRAAASSPSSAPQSPSASAQKSAPSTPTTAPESGRPSKRARTSDGNLSAATPGSARSHDDTMRDIVAEEERKRDEAIERMGKEKGETRWTLDGGDGTNGVHTNVAQRFVELERGDIDGFVSSAATSGGGTAGRMFFGKKPAPMPTGAGEGEDDSSSGSDDSEDEGEYEPQDVDALVNGAAERARQDRKRKRSAERMRGAEMAKDRRRREVRLNSSPGGISSGGGTPRGGSRSSSHAGRGRRGR